MQLFGQNLSVLLFCTKNKTQTCPKCELFFNQKMSSVTNNPTKLLKFALYMFVLYKKLVFVVTLSDVSKDNEQSNFQILYEDTTPIHYSHLHLYKPV